MKRAISLIVSLALVLTLLPAAAQADSPAFGSDVWLQDTPIQEGVTYSENIFWSGSYDKPRHEYYFTYTPGIGGNLPSAWGGTADVPSVPDVPDSIDPNDPSTWGGEDLSWLFPNASPSTKDQTKAGQAAPAGTEPAAVQPVTAISTGVRPVASFGGSVCGRTTVSEAAQKYESQGYRVVGAINGDFYDTSTGYPLGILVSDGELLSGSSEYYAAGFRADGTAVMGEPQLSIVATAGGNSLKLASLNKPRVDAAGVTMLTYDYRDDHTTGSSVAYDGVNVLATIVDGRASIGETLVLRVDEVAEDAEVRTLAENQVLLTGAANGYDVGLGFLRSLTPGETVTVSFTTPDPRWNEVTEAIGAYYLLVENGEAKGGFEVSAAPRTAVGVKANGEVILYTLDGRQDAVSMGASLGVLAKRMAELGCVTALCLDGGGSTTAVAAMPDGTASELLNSPSDKVQRKVSNHLLLLAPGGATGEAGGVYLSAAAPAVLAGHTVRLAANVTDTHYYPMNLPLEFSATAGTVTDGVFTAPAYGGPVTITAAYGMLSARRTIQVLDAPGTLSIRAKDGGSSSVTVIAGNTVQLTASGTYNHLPLEVSPEDLTWTVDPKLGTIDGHGVFTAAMQAGSGTITAARGGVKATLQVTVEANHPFSDLEGHWAEGYMGQLYQQKVLTGEAAADGLLYAYPDRSLSRAEFSVLLARYLGLNTADYAGKATPFVDLSGVESWAGGAIRAMYEKGIVNGVDPTHFDPQAPLERAQAAAMLGRALSLTAESAGVGNAGTESAAVSLPSYEPVVEELPPDGLGLNRDLFLPDEPVLSEEPVMTEQPESLELSQSLTGYPDADEVPEYALAYVQILVAKGALDGRDGKLLPASAITRAEICKALAVMQAE